VLADIWSAGMIVFELVTRKNFWSCVFKSERVERKMIEAYLKEKKEFRSDVFLPISNEKRA
jgi:hypothetical protein